MLLVGRELLTALYRTKRPVLVVALDGCEKLLEPLLAADIVNGTEDWQGRGTKRKVSRISRVKPRPEEKPDPVWSSCWRTMHAAVLPPSPEWFAGMKSSL